MKKNLILALIFLSILSVHGQTSVYHPFPESNAVWNFHLANGFVYCPTGPNQFDYSYVMTGDTVIGYYNYHKLIVPYVPDSNCFYPAGNIVYYRNDIPNRKVFCPNINGSGEALLYDFTLQVDDTVKGIIAQLYCYDFPPVNPPIVSEIDSVLVGGNFRKRWKVVNNGNSWPVYLIEGIGSTFELFKISCSPIILDQTVYSLICFKINGFTLYPNSATNCDVVLSANNIEQNKTTITISPNPFTQSTHISFNQTYGDITLEVFDLQGQLVAKDHYEDCSEIVFYCKQLSEGMYFMKLTLNGKRVETRKIVISE
jgi:hypothetical protein